jgi:hypothetical protein
MVVKYPYGRSISTELWKSLALQKRAARVSGIRAPLRPPLPAAISAPRSVRSLPAV